MAKTKNKSASEPSGVYFLKLVLYVLLGSLWVKIQRTGANVSVPVPIGLIIGLIFTSHEHFRLDRKIEYAVLILAALFGLIAPYGLFINF